MRMHREFQHLTTKADLSQPTFSCSTYLQDPSCTLDRDPGVMEASVYDPPQDRELLAEDVGSGEDQTGDEIDR